LLHHPGQRALSLDVVEAAAACGGLYLLPYSPAHCESMRRDVGAPVQRNPTIVEHCKKIYNMLKECDRSVAAKFPNQLHKDKQNEQASSHKEIFFTYRRHDLIFFSVNYLINKEAVHAMATACFLPSTSLELLEIHLHIHIHIHCCSFAKTLQKLARQRKNSHSHTQQQKQKQHKCSLICLCNV
jgi:hypothetical protein